MSFFHYTVSILIDFKCAVSSIHPRKNPKKIRCCCCCCCSHKVLWPQNFRVCSDRKKTTEKIWETSTRFGNRQWSQLLPVTDNAINLFSHSVQWHEHWFLQTVSLYHCRQKTNTIYLIMVKSVRTSLSLSRSVCVHCTAFGNRQTFLFVISLPFHLNAISVVNWTKHWEI